VHHLPRMVAETPIDKVVKVTVWRKRKEVVLDVKVGELDESEGQVATLTKSTAPAPNTTPPVKELGLSLANVSPELRERFSLAEDVAGVIVTEVEADSPAAEKGVKPGDVIVEVAQQAVKTPAQISDKLAEVRKSGRKSVLLLVDHQGDLRFVALKLGEG
ncbi:MAG TPA: PDZ domain-containing protein, partial [Stellaceae bacterium]|nr:PDZ domain-containing protein [Stellaceae bacterium]